MSGELPIGKMEYQGQTYHFIVDSMDASSDVREQTKLSIEARIIEEEQANRLRESQNETNDPPTPEDKKGVRKLKFNKGNYEKEER